MSRRLLFVSSGHPEPSAAAAAIARSVAGERWEIAYACDNERTIDPAARAVLVEKGIDPINDIPKPPGTLQSEQYDVVVTFCQRSIKLCPTFAGLPAQFHWPLDELVGCGDPRKEDCFRAIYDELEKRVRGLFEHDTVRVITHLRSTFSSLIDHLTDGVMVHDSVRKIFVFNKAAEMITGYKTSEVIGRDCHEVFPGLLCGGECSCGEGDISPDSKPRYPAQYVGRDGEMHDLEMSMVTIQPPGQKSQSVMLIFRDLTEVNRLKRSLQSTKGFQGIIGYHPSMRKIYRAIEDLANENVPVLILGESGTGKELVAEALHRLSDRRDFPLVPVNCGALPEGILESELFGHVKGAFTGAISDKKGRFELADKGTLFLDEIGEISQAMQVKLLRVLETKSFIPIGGEKTIKTDVRIVAATNKDLLAMTQREEFREDLYYRLAVYPMTMPPLRERKSDIPLLVEHIIDHLGYETGRHSAGIDPEVMKIIQFYDWPGNVRQLMNALQFALIKCHGGIIKPEHLPPEVIDIVIPGDVNKVGRPQKLSREIAISVLQRHGGNRSKAAKELGIARSTLYRYIS